MTAQALIDVLESGAIPPPANDVNSRNRTRSIVTIGGDEIAAPLPELPYLIQPLGLAHGAPICVAGYGYSGKTVAMQSMCLALASENRVWGVHAGKAGRVLHIDYEQGARLTRERYQRLARAMDVDLAGLLDQLRLSCLPDVYLDDGDAFDVYARACDGFQFALVDSFRAAGPKIDENSSEVRRYLDTLGRVSEKTGTAIAFIAHAKKPNGEAQARHSVRGSSAIFDACSSVFVVEGTNKSQARVSHEKCRNTGLPVDDFGFLFEDVPSACGSNPKWGLRVTQVDAKRVAQCSRNISFEDRIRNYLIRVAVHQGPKSSIPTVIEMGKTDFFPAFKKLETEGLVECGRDPSSGDYSVRWIGPLPAKTE